MVQFNLERLWFNSFVKYECISKGLTSVVEILNLIDKKKLFKQKQYVIQLRFLETWHQA